MKMQAVMKTKKICKCFDLGTLFAVSIIMVIISIAVVKTENVQMFQSSIFVCWVPS